MQRSMMSFASSCNCIVRTPTFPHPGLHQSLMRLQKVDLLEVALVFCVLVYVGILLFYDAHVLPSYLNNQDTQDAHDVDLLAKRFFSFATIIRLSVSSQRSRNQQ